MASFQARVSGALQLRAGAFEDVEQDASATPQAAMVVAAAAVSGGLASLGTIGIAGVGVGLVFGLLGWAIGSYVVLIVGTKVLPGKNTQADYGQMLRTMGFAQAPGILGIAAIVPVLGVLVSLAIALWTLGAMVVAVRQALDYDDTVRAVMTCLVAWVIMLAAWMAAAFVGVGGAVLSSGMM